MNIQVTRSPIASEPAGSASLGRTFEACADELIASFPQLTQLSSVERQGIISRYGTVLEGNFIYWMTACFVAAKSDKARAIIRENLSEEIRDCHPGMLRRFVRAAGATQSQVHIDAVESNLTAVREFVGRLSPTALIAMMAFFEMFIQRFMPVLAAIATQQGSEEQEYTRVHGTCDILHSQELILALTAEMAIAAPSNDDYAGLFDGVGLLSALIRDIVFGPAACQSGH
jgi:hypothetical protein